MRPVVVLEEAIEDIEKARTFYAKVGDRIGEYCENCLVAEIESLVRFHGSHGKHFGFHRVICRPFPFGIYYREQEKRTEVFAILDLRRDPSWLRSEIFERNR